MLKRIDSLINILMGCSVGVFLGRTLFQYIDYRRYPNLYEMQSAPWYLSIQLWGIGLIVLLIVCVSIKFIIHSKERKAEADNEKS